jgi:hypothetical protein
VAVSVVGLRMVLESNGLDGPMAFEERSGNTVHTIHDPTVVAEDDRIRHVDFSDPSNMIHDPSHCRRVGGLIEPVDRVDLPD